MMRAFLLAFSVLLMCSGCAILTDGPFASKTTETALPPELRLKVGMTRAEVSAIMDRPVVVGYEIDPASGKASPVEAKSLFSTELMTVGGKEYQVDKYIIRSDNGIAVTAEDLLFPVVFERGLLVAKGHDGLEQLKSR
jgi:hypothetical protein